MIRNVEALLAEVRFGGGGGLEVSFLARSGPGEVWGEPSGSAIPVLQVFKTTTS